MLGHGINKHLPRRPAAWPDTRHQRGKQVRETYDHLRLNTRIEYATIGDLGAQVAAIHTGEPPLGQILDQIGVTFSQTTVLCNIELDIHSGEIHGLTGESDTGKSTLGKVISGHYSTRVGQLTVFGQQMGLT